MKIILLLFIFWLYHLCFCEFCKSQVFVEQDFLLRSKDFRTGIYFKHQLKDNLNMTIGYERMKFDENINTSLFFSFTNYSLYLLYEKRSMGFAIDKRIGNHLLYLELNNLKEKELNFYYYYDINSNFSFKFGLEKLNKGKIDPMVGFFILLD